MVYYASYMWVLPPQLVDGVCWVYVGVFPAFSVRMYKSVTIYNDCGV